MRNSPLLRKETLKTKCQTDIIDSKSFNLRIDTCSTDRKIHKPIGNNNGNGKRMRMRMGIIMTKPPQQLHHSKPP